MMSTKIALNLYPGAEFLAVNVRQELRTVTKVPNVRQLLLPGKCPREPPSLSTFYLLDRESFVRERAPTMVCVVLFN